MSAGQYLYAKETQKTISVFRLTQKKVVFLGAGDDKKWPNPKNLIVSMN
ncbi:unnamed protein product [marine sediment metagenome]|uniref:Uncharacterized protein n=1 Tax=marine sediment metagenome TaxID=412755 RepID=X1S0B1_9ZZZZ